MIPTSASTATRQGRRVTRVLPPALRDDNRQSDLLPQWKKEHDTMQRSPQTSFLLRHLADQSIDCAKPAQEDDTPIYDFEQGEFDFAELKKMRNDIRDFLFKYYDDLKDCPISENEHKKRLRSLCTTLTRRSKSMLSGAEIPTGYCTADSQPVSQAALVSRTH